MQLVADLHMHTIVSNHAVGTLTEMITAAKNKGLKAIAITDHGTEMPDSAHPWYFSTLSRLPDFLDGILVLKGVEANVLSSKGNIDMDEEMLKRLDWVIASMHAECIAPLSYEDATNAWLAVAQNPLVDMIGHSEQRQYAYDYDTVTKAFTANHKVVELNENSAEVRPGNEKNLELLIDSCKKNGTKVSINSDAHAPYNVGKQGLATAYIEKIQFPKELIINSTYDLLLNTLKEHKKPICNRIINEKTV